MIIISNSIFFFLLRSEVLASSVLMVLAIYLMDWFGEQICIRRRRRANLLEQHQNHHVIVHTLVELPKQLVTKLWQMDIFICHSCISFVSVAKQMQIHWERGHICAV